MVRRSFTGLAQSSFLIYETGNIMGAWYKIKTENNIPEAKKVLGPLRRTFLGEGA
jgi:hypothetical protein